MTTMKMKYEICCDDAAIIEVHEDDGDEKSHNRFVVIKVTGFQEESREISGD